MIVGYMAGYMHKRSSPAEVERAADKARRKKQKASDAHMPEDFSIDGRERAQTPATYSPAQ